MKTCQRKGKMYRELREEEVICHGDMFSERSFTRWFEVNDSVGYKVSDYRRRYTGSCLTWYREIDPLIAAMLKVKGQTDG